MQNSSPIGGRLKVLYLEKWSKFENKSPGSGFTRSHAVYTVYGVGYSNLFESIVVTPKSYFSKLFATVFEFLSPFSQHVKSTKTNIEHKLQIMEINKQDLN